MKAVADALAITRIRNVLRAVGGVILGQWSDSTNIFNKTFKVLSHIYRTKTKNTSSCIKDFFSITSVTSVCVNDWWLYKSVTGRDLQILFPLRLIKSTNATNKQAKKKKFKPDLQINRLWTLTRILRILERDTICGTWLFTIKMVFCFFL